MPPPAAPAPPRHVAIIMDGNGRWAAQRHFPRIEGHRQGVKATQRAVSLAGELGVAYLTLYAFSSENWNRPEDEISALIALLEAYLPRELDRMVAHGIRLRVIGRLDRFPERTRAMVADALARTAHFTARHLTIALNYGSRQELEDATRALATEVAAGRLAPAEIDYTAIARRLYTHDLPDPDLVIRTSGEHRMSNFLLLQSAYAEWVFLPVLWPDFDREHFEEALRAFACRERRYGKTSAQIAAPAAAPS